MVLAVVVAGSAIGTATSAVAKQKETLDLKCNDGRTYLVELQGNGDWTPAHVVGSTKVFVPVAFGAFTATFTDPEGNVGTFTDPPTAKGSGKHRVDLTCTFTFSGSDDGFTFSGTGSVDVKVTGRR